MIRTEELFQLVERLRREAIGNPQWIAERQVYEYQDHSAKVVAILKLIRAAQGVASLELLRRAGLFIDFGVVIRCIHDCTSEAYFLLENFPQTSGSVDQFVKSFFEGDINGYLTSETPTVPTKKIRNAVVRVLKDGQDEATRILMERIYKTFCGYVHAGYANIMEIFGGPARDFNLAGVPSDDQQRRLRIDHVELAANSVIHAAAFVAHKLGMNELHRDIMRTWQ